MHNNLALRRGARKMLTCKLSVVNSSRRGRGQMMIMIDRQTDDRTSRYQQSPASPRRPCPQTVSCRDALRRWQQRPLTDFLRVNHTRDFDLLLLNEASFFTHWRAREAEVSMGSSSVAGGGRGGGRIGVGIYNLALTGSVSLAVY